MSKIIQCLRYLEKPRSKDDIAKQLSLNYLDLLVLLGKINQIELNLINLNRINNIFVTRKLNWLNIDFVRKKLFEDTQCPFSECIYLEEIGSTNTYIKDNLHNISNGAIVTAEFQAKGRGRDDSKSWNSKIAHDIAVSFLKIFPLEFSYELLPLIIAVGVNRLFKQLRVKTKIKWPNDIYLSGSSDLIAKRIKVGGILVESITRNDSRYVIIGIGINNIVDDSISRDELFINLMKHVQNVLTEYNTFGFSLLRREWLDNCIHYKKNVKITKQEKLVDKGIHVDINDFGKLQIKSSISGNIKEYSTTSLSLEWD